MSLLHSPGDLQPMIIMSRLLKNRCWLVFVFGLLAKTGFAQAPSGDFEFTFDPAFDPIINMSGTFQSQQSIIGAGGTETPILISADITNMVSGGLRGSGFAIVQLGDPATSTNVVPAAYIASGRVSGGGGHLTRVILSIHLTGSGTISGVTTVFNILLRYNLIFNSETGTLDGTCRGSASFSNIGGGPVRSDVSVAVPSGSDGSWRLDLQILAFNRLGGSGQIIVSGATERSIPGILHGTFQPGLGRSVLNLTGNNEGLGMFSRIILLNSESGVTLQRVQGRVLGQVINFSF